jgi:SAM domain (Sterile alpha motif)
VEAANSRGAGAMQQVANWLEKLGLGQYAQRFAENDISFSVLPDLTDQHLEKIGVASLGHRLQLLRAIAELSSGEKDAPSAAAPTAPTAAPQDTAERRQVTVMFSDLVGSTALSARMDPEDLREGYFGLPEVRGRDCAALWRLRSEIHGRRRAYLFRLSASARGRCRESGAGWT